MARHEFRALDWLRVSVTGKQPQRLLSAAAQAGIRMRGIRSDDAGFFASLPGRDLRRLSVLAQNQGLELAVLQNRGPGSLLQRLWLRPGLAAGTILFFVLVHFLSGFVWSINFGTLDQAQAETVRAFLNENGLREGTYVSQELLAQMQKALEGQTGLFGWVGLNFAGGCLFVESTPMEEQQIRQPQEQIALYSAADAEIVLIQVESGFSQVEPGQLVAEGQLLAAAERFDREGNSVFQSAAGHVIGRIRRGYTAEQPYEETAAVLTDRTSSVKTLYLLGTEIPLGEETVLSNAQITENWEPLVLGRIALPGCIHTKEYRAQENVSLTYSEQTAQAMARRECVLALLDEYPDAEIEQQSFAFESSDGGVVCRASFVFCADIAVPGQAQPLEKPAT